MYLHGTPRSEPLIQRGTHTPVRNVRVPDDLWNAAKAAAEEQGRTVTDVITAALRRFVERHNRK